MIFEIIQSAGSMRAGIIRTSHGNIKTPAFITVGTKATVKSLTPEMVRDIGAQAILANTYHLYLEPGHEIIRKSGGFVNMMHWQGPSFTDSGGFQVFSLGAAFGQSVSKVAQGGSLSSTIHRESREDLSIDAKICGDESPTKSLVDIDEEGVTFKSIIDGSSHRFTPEYAMQVQHALGADIMFAFDECTSPNASYEYQRRAMERTHRWAKRCIKAHSEAKTKQALYGVVQGGRYEDLRRDSARVLGAMDFDGYGIGGSFDKEDLSTAVKWVCEELPPNKPRHLLGIGDPRDLWEGVEAGIDTFDCVAPTRLARHGSLYTDRGVVNILNTTYREDFTPIQESCECYTCKHYTRAYIAHLFRAKEMLAATLASIHNLYFITHIVDNMREAILNGTFKEAKEIFLSRYYREI